ncbi:MAG: hypothetical protein EOO47_18580 [Flavobacterium sp.]|nr:MAG: hypothetical protein EOO47_18580 [Flavobacterium sp.]
MKIKQIAFLAAIVIASTTACKKSKVEPVVEPPVTPPTTTPTTSRADLSRDSIFLYAKEVYLWNDKLPTYEIFNPRKYTNYTDNLDNYEQELFEITKYSNPFEYKSGYTSSKYSYIFDRANQNPTAFVPTQVASVDLEGNGNDLGVKLGAYGTSSTDQNAYALFVTAVYPGSPAALANMIRTDRITKVNGRTIGANFSNDQSFINTAFAANTITIEGTKYVNGVAGTTFSVSLTKASYKSNPIYSTKVFTVGAKKVGYFAYGRFSSMDNSKPAFDEAFNTFSTSGVTDLIVDLRYNGGGYVATAKYLIDLIAPSTANGSLMFAEHYNANMQAGNAKIMGNQPLLDANDKIRYQNGRMLTYNDVSYTVANNTEHFEKTGPLTNITNIVFIITGSTASASELVINSLKPYMNVKLVGEASYGKPVGFFPIRIENKYDVYYSMFTTKNSLGQGDYYDGFTPDVVEDFDNPLYNFGDAKEDNIAAALNILAPNTPVTATAVKTMSIGGRTVNVQTLAPMKPVVSGNEFVGMIQTKHKVK